MRSRLRFLIAISLALGLGGWLAWTSLGGTLETYASPGHLRAGETYRLNGTVAPGAPRDAALLAQGEGGLRFSVRDKADPAARVAVLYRGSVPDTFKVGREVVITGRLERGVFVAERNSLITLCPSKFQAKPEGSARST